MQYTHHQFQHPIGIDSPRAASHPHPIPSPSYHRDRDALCGNALDGIICFKHSLYLIPCLLIAIHGSVDLCKFSRRPVIHPQSSNATVIKLCQLTYFSKLCLIIAVSVIQLAYSCFLLIRFGWWDPGQCISSLLLCVSLLYALPLHHLSHQRSQRSCTSLLFFYLFLLIISAIELRDHLPRSLLIVNPLPHQTSFLILRSLLLAAIFALECLGPFKYHDDDHHHTFSLGNQKNNINPNKNAYRPLSQDQSSLPRLESPLVYANVFSRLTFGWITPLMKLGQHLAEHDLWRLPRADQADALTNRIHQTWSRQRSRTHSDPSLIRAIVHAYGGPYLLAVLFKCIQDILQFAQPLLLSRLLTFADSYSHGNQPEPLSHGYTIAALMFCCGLVQTLFQHQYAHRAFVTGIRVRSGLIGLIYQKSLVLSNQEKSGRSTGDIVNLMSTDVSRIQGSCSDGLILVSGIFQITLAFISLYTMLGWPMLGGVVVVLLSIPFNMGLSRLYSKLQKVQMENKDSRTRLMNEILNNIRSSVPPIHSIVAHFHLIKYTI
jgi:hypothetical protein